jgi:division protein CdvB (Snf7/Vps24/ESCRT-III family)
LEYIKIEKRLHEKIKTRLKRDCLSDNDAGRYIQEAWFTFNRQKYRKGNKRSIFNRLTNRFNDSKPTEKEKIVRASYLLSATLAKLKNINLGIKRRDHKLFEKCIKANLKKNRMKAIVYANECVELRRIAQIVLSSELSIEQAILRLDTISEISDLIVAVDPILGIVQETKGRLANFIPSVAEKLGEVNTVLGSTMTAMSSFHSLGVKMKIDSVGIKVNSEAEKILKEANDAAEERIRDRFPEMPLELKISKKKSERKMPVDLMASGWKSNSFKQKINSK